jgi:glycosyltransferase involved in cell wall biosynthesis
MLNVVRTAESFAAVADETVFISRRGKVDARDELNKIYGVGDNFRWLQVPGWFESRIFPPLVLPLILRERPDVVIARHWTLPLWTARAGIASILEAHDLRGAYPPLIERYRRACATTSSFCGIAINSEAYRQSYIEGGIPAQRIVAVPAAAKLENYTQPAQLPPSPYPNSDRPKAVYTGHLYEHKGIPQILQAAESLPNVDFHLVGGMAEDVAEVRGQATAKQLTNLYLHGMQASSDLPRWLWHADVLLLPPPGGESPLKLAEYLASGRPIIAADQPGLRSLVSNTEVFWAQAGDGQALASGIRTALANPIEAQARAQEGLSKVQLWSYPQRARNILSLCYPKKSNHTL